MRLLYLCDSDSGGIAEYAIRQGPALCKAGVEVTFLCRPTFPMARLERVTVRSCLPMAPGGAGSKLRRLLRRIADTRAVARIIAEAGLSGDYDALLIACYAEYVAPLWAPILREACTKGLRIGTIAHDPVRDFVVGPRWWHRWSVRQAYSFVHVVFVHDETPIDFGGRQPKRISTRVIPHGPYEVASATRERVSLRRRHGLVESDRVFLAFGQVRDGKNLDRFIRAMVHLPESVKLLVAGSGGSESQRPPEFYVRFAEELGVAHRCVWDLRYIPDAETGNIFTATNFVLLTYSAKFRSASGVLNAAVACRKPVLASSGPGPLKSAVEGYGLGVFVAPDDDGAILAGARRLLGANSSPEWDRYERENSWERNATLVAEAFVSP